MTFSPEQIEIRRKRALAWNRAHPDRVARAHRLYYLKNKKKIDKAARAYHRKHKKDFLDRQRAWRQAHPWYQSWTGAKQRCQSPKHSAYKRYGGRGIKFFLSKADMQFMWVRDNAKDLFCPSLDRINNDGDYVLENCHFIELSDNAKKKMLDNWKRKQKEEQEAHAAWFKENRHEFPRVN